MDIVSATSLEVISLWKFIKSKLKSLENMSCVYYGLSSQNWQMAVGLLYPKKSLTAKLLTYG